MPTITIQLTDTQYKGLEYAAVSPEDWAENAVAIRAQKSNDEIVNLTVQHCLDNGVQVPATRADIVAYAFENGVVKTAVEREQELLANVVEA